MNTPIIVIPIIFVIFLYIRYRAFGNIMFVHTILSLSLIFLITLVYFVSFDNLLIHNINIDEVKDVSRRTMNDIYKSTTIKNNKGVIKRKKF